MTIAQFMKEIESIRGEAFAFECGGKPMYSEFRLNADSHIESSNEMCPIAELAMQRYVNGEDYWDEGLKLGLSNKAVRAITQAADGKPGRLRQRLLKACGIF